MSRLLLALSLAVAAGCSGTPAPGATDTGSGSPDTGGNAVDAASGVDSGRAAIDSGIDASSAIDAASATDASATDSGSAPDAPSANDAGGSLTVCGGFGGAVCGATEYCQYAGPVPCGAADGTGVCRARPTSCPPDTAAVCGCNNVTYTSACTAAMAGTDVASTGACATGTTFACGPSMQCTASVEYCRITMGGPFPGTTSYACTTLTTCTTGSTPSCATCFPGSSVGNMCMDLGPGEMSVTLLTP